MKLLARLQRQCRQKSFFYFSLLRFNDFGSFLVVFLGNTLKPKSRGAAACLLGIGASSMDI
jgi:hypothetical protein